MAAYDIALQEEQAGLAAAPTLPAADYDVEPEHTMEYQTTEYSDVYIRITMYKISIFMFIYSGIFDFLSTVLNNIRST